MLLVPRPLDVRICPDSLKNEESPTIEVLKGGEQEEDEGIGKKNACPAQQLFANMDVHWNAV